MRGGGQTARRVPRPNSLMCCCTQRVSLSVSHTSHACAQQLPCMRPQQLRLTHKTKPDGPPPQAVRKTVTRAAEPTCSTSRRPRAPPVSSPSSAVLVLVICVYLAMRRSTARFCDTSSRVVHMHSACGTFLVTSTLCGVLTVVDGVRGVSRPVWESEGDKLVLHYNMCDRQFILAWRLCLVCLAVDKKAARVSHHKVHVSAPAAAQCHTEPCITTCPAPSPSPSSTHAIRPTC